MSEILSQDEVDSLLSGLTAGKVKTETTVQEEIPSSDVGAYDFASQERVIRARMPTYDVINERFAREFRNSISNLLRTNADISTEALDTLKFSEFGRSLPVPTSLHVFRMDPFRGHGLIVLESQLVFNLIDTFFGGKGTGKARVEGREFTTIEDVMIRKVVVACLKDLENAWAPIEEVKTSLSRSEVNPQFAAIVMPTDLVIVSRFEIELEQSAGTLIICIPYSMIEPIRSKLVAGFQAEVEDVDYTWQRRLKAMIMESEVNFSVRLGTTEITGERLISMKPGDIIQLDQDADQPIIGLIEGRPKMEGIAGIQRGFQAFKLQKKLTLI
jgi:flagellar motor switch protein FliM